MCVDYEPGHGCEALPQAVIGAQPTEMCQNEVGIECLQHTTSGRVTVLIIRRSGQAMARSLIMGE